jgi:hypothetical protein
MRNLAKRKNDSDISKYEFHLRTRKLADEIIDLKEELEELKGTIRVLTVLLADRTLDK